MKIPNFINIEYIRMILFCLFHFFGYEIWMDVLNIFTNRVGTYNTYSIIM